GFRHDVCAAIHPMAVASPVFRALGLIAQVDWLTARFALAHPLDDGRVAVLSRRMSETVESLEDDGLGWQRLVRPFASRGTAFFSEVLRPVRMPSHPILMARFGAMALQSSHRVQRRF